MAQKAKEKRAQEKAAAEVKAKADAEGDKRMAENAAYAAELAKEASVPEPTGIAKIVADTKAKKEETEKAISVPEANLPATVPATHVVQSGPHYSSDEMIILREIIAKNCTEPEFKILLYMARQYGLDPMLKQIWAVKRNERDPALIFVGRDGMLAIAHRSGQFDGMQSGVVYEGEGKDKHPVSAWCEIWRKDMSHSFKSEVLFSEYNTGFSVWKSNPSAMIIKVVESVGLRKAFSVSGVYSPEEISERP